MVASHMKKNNNNTGKRDYVEGIMFLNSKIEENLSKAYS